jgi:hypothetical protein
MVRSSYHAREQSEALATVVQEVAQEVVQEAQQPPSGRAEAG